MSTVNYKAGQIASVYVLLPYSRESDINLSPSF